MGKCQLTIGLEGRERYLKQYGDARKREPINYL